jgi:hypothetical protein
MAIPTPDSLIAVVKPVLDTTAGFISKLSALMADAGTVNDAYRGAGQFSFYVPGYINPTVEIEVSKALVTAGYVVHAFKQQVGYMPAAHMVDIEAADYTNEGVTGNSQFLWVQVTISKKKVVE